MTAVTVVLHVDVIDEDMLMEYARKRYDVCWASTFEADNDRPMSLADAVFEALVGSNENPAPLDIGVEIRDWQTHEYERRNG